MIHAHVDFSGIKGYFLVRAMEPGDTGRECDCLDGELELFHDACEAGEVDESCPCPTCQGEREDRFNEWRRRDERAAVVAEHTRAKEGEPRV